jgi:hypothetical protein
MLELPAANAKFFRLLVPALENDLEFYVPDNVGSEGCVLCSDGQGNLYWAQPHGEGGVGAENTSRTVELQASMTQAQLQEAIDAAGRYIPYGVEITFQFADGTYELIAPLEFRGFFGGGTVNVLGNTMEENALTWHTSQQVFLDATGASPKACLRFHQCSLYMIRVYNIKGQIDTCDHVSGACVNFINCASPSEVKYGCFYATVDPSHQKGHGIDAWQSLPCVVEKNTVGKFGAAITASYSLLHSYDNKEISASEKPGTALYARYGGVIVKQGTQPAGDYAENTWIGGEIR